MAYSYRTTDDGGYETYSPLMGWKPTEQGWSPDKAASTTQATSGSAYDKSGLTPPTDQKSGGGSGYDDNAPVPGPTTEYQPSTSQTTDPNRFLAAVKPNIESEWAAWLAQNNAVTRDNYTGGGQVVWKMVPDGQGGSLWVRSMGAEEQAYKAIRDRWYDQAKAEAVQARMAAGWQDGKDHEGNPLGTYMINPSGGTRFTNGYGYGSYTGPEAFGAGAPGNFNPGGATPGTNPGGGSGGGSGGGTGGSGAGTGGGTGGSSAGTGGGTAPTEPGAGTGGGSGGGDPSGGAQNGALMDAYKQAELGYYNQAMGINTDTSQLLADQAQAQAVGYDPVTRNAATYEALGRGADTYSAVSRGADTYAASGREGLTREVTPEEMSSYQMENLLDPNSPLSKRARQEGIDYAASRGLMNSSIAGAAAYGAWIDRVQPYAMQNAQAYGTAASENLSAQNTAASETLGFANQAARDNAQFRNTALSENMMAANQAARDNSQARNQAASETLAFANQAAADNMMAQNTALSENMAAANRALSENASAQNAAALANASNKLQAQLAVLDIQAQRDSQVREYLLTSSSDTLRAALNIESREDTQAFDAWLDEQRRRWNTYEREAGQQWQTGERVGGQGWQSGENAAQRGWESGENAAQRDWQSGENTAQRGWQTGERLSSQDYNTDEREAIEAFTRGERIDTQDWTDEQRRATENFQAELADLDAALRLAAISQQERATYLQAWTMVQTGRFQSIGQAASVIYSNTDLTSAQQNQAINNMVAFFNGQTPAIPAYQGVSYDSNGLPLFDFGVGG